MSTAVSNVRPDPDKVLVDIADYASKYQSVRAGWREAALRMAKEGLGLVYGPTPTRFDAEEWEWK